MLPHARAIGLAVFSSSLGFVAAYLTIHPRAPTAAVVAPVPRPLPLAVTAPCVSPPSDSRSALPPSFAPARPPPFTAPLALPRNAPPAALEPSAPLFAPRAPLLGSFHIVGIGPSGGLRLGRVGPRTLAAAIGLRTGDELLSINQFELGNPEQALTAYARLRAAERLTLAVARRGKRTEIVYSIR